MTSSRIGGRLLLLGNSWDRRLGLVRGTMLALPSSAVESPHPSVTPSSIASAILTDTKASSALSHASRFAKSSVCLLGITSGFRAVLCFIVLSSSEEVATGTLRPSFGWCVVLFKRHSSIVRRPGRTCKQVRFPNPLPSISDEVKGSHARVDFGSDL